MGHVFLLAMLVCAVVSLAYPWVGVLYGYLFVVMQPQEVWWWDFINVRATFWVIVPTCIGVLIGLARKSLNFEPLKDKRNLFILLLWAFSVLSYFFGAYVHTLSPYRFSIPAVTLSRLNKIIFFYFVACICIDTQKKAKYLYVVMLVSVGYLTYWANNQYWTGHWFGRLQGPTSAAGGGLYIDQNDFAMVFAVAQPFLWYFGVNCKSKLMSAFWWLLMPLSWNAIFLTGSRGGFLGLVVAIILIVVRSKRRILGLALIPIFLLVFLRDAGPIMAGRVISIDHYQVHKSAEDRLHAWQAAGRMIAAHPIVGVGLASFGPAFPHYSNHHPREAHDTFLQITAESGVFAGAMYLMIAFTLISALWKNGNDLKNRGAGEDASTLLMINEAVMIGFTGLVVCSIFLSLQEFEIFYCLNVLGNAVLYVSRNYSDRSESRLVTHVENACDRTSEGLCSFSSSKSRRAVMGILGV